MNSSTFPARTRAQIIIAALWLALGPAVAIGFGRFAYALVLPAMKSDLGWTYSQAGLLNTANAVGYLGGALAAAPLLRRISARTTLLGGLAAASLALGLAGLTHEYALLLAARALVGTAAAFTFISASTLAAQLGRNDDEHALALGISISGPGFGTAATGIIVPFVLHGDISHWPRAWWMMGAIGLILLPFIALNTRERSGEAVAHVTPPFTLKELRPIAPIIVAYFLFGAGYIAYMTFLVAYVRALQASATTVAFVWVMLGGAMIASSVVWKNALAQNRGGQTMALMGLGGAAAALLPLTSGALPVLVLSAIGFGLATMPIFTAVSMLIRRHIAPELWSGAFAWSTVLFACGQSLGPFASGALSDAFGLKASLLWTTIIMSIGALIAWRHAASRPTREHTTRSIRPQSGHPEFDRTPQEQA